MCSKFSVLIYDTLSTMGFANLPSGLILVSVLFFVLSTEESLYDEAPWVFDGVESFTVIVFTLEYALRVSTLSVSPKWGWGSSE